MGWRSTILGEDESPCQHPNPGKYCPDCGLLMDLPRLRAEDIFSSSPAAWQEKSFRRTLSGLILRPGPAIRTYLFQNRSYLVKPATYLLLALAFRVWVDHLLSGTETCAATDGFCQMWAEEGTSLRFVQIGLFALVYRMAFRKAGLNLWEYGVGFSYIIAQASIIAGVLSLLLAFAEPLTAGLVVLAAQSVYMILATIQFLQIRGRGSILGAVLLGAVTVILYVAGVMALADIWLDDTAPAAADSAAPAASVAAPPQ
ncbi:DUF3667 domain-containing protein [Paracoccus sp. S1E-3]|uniref:DUF3667 domain-containing protein n=1 Tax=Paracoccus sp. S1E-3 TaxID=2756130 RepID=UPI0015EE8E2B|nr:DUF3667 domain-containing protein [Paracoccus sp. S1E-3]MBA4489963.1 DUF3667 domain-containing protein [Paracoccus sp. S1E-3]